VNRRQFLAVSAAVSVSPARASSGSAEPPRAAPFLWGVATAAHQIEGNNVNSDYWLLESLPDSGFAEPSGDACDSWERWREDVALVAAMGLNAYRFSIEWARIEPEPGRFSRSVLDHYRRLIAACREAGIAPVVTFHHYTSPRWIAAMGGWLNPTVADRYARYCGVAAAALGDSIDWACTFNEINASITSYLLRGGKPWPNEAAQRAAAAKKAGSDRFASFWDGDARVTRDIMLVGHAKGLAAIKAAAPHVKVGMTLALSDLAPGPGGEALYRSLVAETRAPFFAAADRDDFVGVQTYARERTGADAMLPTCRGAERDAWGRDCDPSALGSVVRDVRRHCRAPAMVTENGINTTDDTQRARHLTASIAGLRAVMAEGTPVPGYMHWSLIDNFEWSLGYTPRFGLTAVDRTTFRRSPKPSSAAYARIVRAARG